MNLVVLDVGRLFEDLADIRQLTVRELLCKKSNKTKHLWEICTFFKGTTSRFQANMVSSGTKLLINIWY